MIDRETVERIKSAADIVEVVGDYVNLTRRGANYMGLCPFHNERTPSFSVSPRRNFCYCFSCHKGGSPVNFIMEKEGVSYYDALRQLARKYNIPIEEKELTDEERRRITEREAMLVASEWATEYFHKNLYESEEGRNVGLAYLYGRGITDEAIRKFGIGYSTDRGNAFVSAAQRAGYDLEVLRKLGLTGRSNDGRDYDKFRGRIMFPIRNSSGKTVAFGGRDLKGGPAKYINSPETLLYKKSNELYGIFEAKPDIVKKDKVLLMEGYLDVIGSWQAGVTNAVASSGTSLTDGQIALIHRFTDKVTIVYDGDSAGIKAAFRGIDMLLSHKMQVNVLLLPEGEDPDSFARKHTPEEFLRYISDHEADIIEFKADVMMKGAGDSSQKKTQAVMSVVESIASIPNDVERALYIQKCSIMMKVDEKSVARAVADRRHAILENLRTERRLKKQDRDYPSAPVGSSGDDTTTDVPEQSPADTPRNASTGFFKESPIIPIERILIRYLVRYGFMEAVEVEDEEGNPFFMSVIDYVSEELEADSLKFSHPVYAATFSILMQMRPAFEDAFASFRKELAFEIEKRRRQATEDIAMRGLPMDEIRKEEIRLDESLRQFHDQSLLEFSRDWPGNQLSSHEDDDVRRLATELLYERHQLSAIYFREGQTVETEEQRLSENVPRAIAELRSEVLSQRVKRLNASLRDPAVNSSPEKVREVMVELQKLMMIRSRIAEDLGERILSPR